MSRPNEARVQAAGRRRSDGPKPLWEQYATWCIHFNGIMSKVCDAGISYDDPRFGERQQYRRELPCLKDSPSAPTRTDLCDKCEYLTEEQAKAKAEESRKRTRAYFEKMESGVCPECDRKIERQRQVGPCVYASPCGHRMFQGRAQKPSAPIAALPRADGAGETGS